MQAEGLIGSRIRERRQVVGLRQADLARQAGISASYLNLIEHNRRRIGGKLLLQIADVLGVASTVLIEGAEAALIASLRESEAGAQLTNVELDRIEEFAGRFPGWAGLLAATHDRAQKLEQSVEELSDRIAHDPALAASVHEVLSTAASIRSTASILAETDSLEPEWLDRFHGNINEDSARLAESSRALAGYLEQTAPGGTSPQFPSEDVDAYLSTRGYVIEELETSDGDVESVVRASNLSDQAKTHLRPILQAYARDARRLPLQRVHDALSDMHDLDPLELARQLACPLPTVLRRLASVVELGAGYVMCDRAGNLLVRKALPGFSLPRFGASCPFWPLFQAMSQPGTVVCADVEQLGRRQDKVVCYAVSETMETTRYNQPPLIYSGMLILPSTKPGEPDYQVGASCRICPRTGCPGRSETSVMTELM